MSGKSTAKQVSYAIFLMGKSGYDTRYMGSAHRKLGARMADVKGTVEAWLSRMNVSEISQLIDRLKGVAA